METLSNVEHFYDIFAQNNFEVSSWIINLMKRQNQMKRKNSRKIS